MPSNIVTVAGVQAANTSGIFEESPSANTRSERKYKRNPKNNPLETQTIVPPRRVRRREKVAAISTIAVNKSGEAN